MAEKNESKKKLTPFEQEQLDTRLKILEYKRTAEVNVVTIIYKSPAILYENKIDSSDFDDNACRVYFEIAKDIIINKGKTELDSITVGFYLEKHPKLRAKYEEYGGHDIIDAKAYVKVEDFDSYFAELRKWKAVLYLCTKGIAVSNRLSDFEDCTSEDIYDLYSAHINNAFINVIDGLKSYNAFENLDTLVEELDQGEEGGMPLYDAPMLTEEIGGFNLNGHIYGLGAGSGVGKSTMAFNYLVPSAIEHKEKIVFIVNEEDEKKLKKELLIWIANHIYPEEAGKYLQKQTLRKGKFAPEVKSLLKKCAKWASERKKDRTLTIIPLQSYSVNTVVKLINKYSSMGVRIFVLDTFKESVDATTDEIYKSMMRDMRLLYDTVKPVARNVGLFVTYQLGKGSLKLRHLTNNEIGQAKSIVDVMSVNLMMRRPYEDEFEEGRLTQLKCWKPAAEGKKKKSKIEVKLDPENKKYMLTFITKNRFGPTDELQIVSECDLSTNIHRDIGYTFVPQDW